MLQCWQEAMQSSHVVCGSMLPELIQDHATVASKHRSAPMHVVLVVICTLQGLAWLKRYGACSCAGYWRSDGVASYRRNRDSLFCFLQAVTALIKDGASMSEVLTDLTQQG